MHIVCKCTIFYDSSEMTFWKKQNWAMGKRSVVTKGLVKGLGLKGGSIKELQDGETILYDPVMVDTW